MLRRNRGKGLYGTRGGAVLESRKLTVKIASQQDPAACPRRRASQPAEQVAEFEAQSSCFERDLSSSSSNWSAHVESSSSATWLSDALRGERAFEPAEPISCGFRGGQSGSAAGPMQQGHHADTSREGCRAVAVASEPVRFWDFWPET